MVFLEQKAANIRFDGEVEKHIETEITHLKL